MKRIYITAVPLESNFVLAPVRPDTANFALPQQPARAAFPITHVIAATMQEGDSAVVIAVRQQNAPENANLRLLQQELQSLALKDWVLRDITIPENQQRDELIALFEKLAEAFEENACYYACITFGTKTFPIVLLSALRYAERLLQNTQIKGIYYREFVRRGSTVQTVRMYDVSVLFTLDGIVDMAAHLGVTGQKDFIRFLLMPKEDGCDGTQNV